MTGNAPAEIELRNVRLVVAYDGAEFRGFSPSTGVRTVLGLLSDTIGRIVRRPVTLFGAGRTDAGVHGWGQVVSGQLPAATDLGRLQHSFNRMCGPEIAIRDARWVEPGFHARFSATSRSYRYEVWNDPVPNPLVARSTWHVHQPLDLPLMNEAADRFVGEHDFSSFCRRPKVADDRPEPRLVRIVRTARWGRVDDTPLLRFEITASSFCQQMVRSIVGTTVDVGRRRHDGAIAETLAARDRARAGTVAPPYGLVLWEVGYDGERWDR